VADYYVANAPIGNDANSGLSELLPWETINKVNSGSYNPNDTINWNRGDTFNDEYLLVSDAGTSGNTIDWDAYGIGAPPIISGGAVASTFTATSLAPYLSFPGTPTNDCWVANDPNLQITGLIDLRADLASDDWDMASGDDQGIISKWTSGQQTWNWRLVGPGASGGKQTSSWRIGGVSRYPGAGTNAFDTLVGDGVRVQLRVTLDTTTGDVDYFYRLSVAPDPVGHIGWRDLKDNTGWVADGSRSITAGELDVGTSTVTIGAGPGVNDPFGGKMYQAVVMSGISGTVQLDVDFTAQMSGTTSFTEDSTNGYTVTLDQTPSPQCEFVAAANVWEATSPSGANDPGVCFMDDTRGVQKGSLEEVTSEFDWFHDSDTSKIYVYAVTDPDSRYSTVETGVNTYACRINADYNTFSNLTFRYSQSSWLYYMSPTGGDYCTHTSCIFERGAHAGVFIHGNRTAGITFNDCISRWNTGMGYQTTGSNVTWTDCTAFRNGRDSFTDGGSGWLISGAGIVLNRCLSDTNGNSSHDLGHHHGFYGGAGSIGTQYLWCIAKDQINGHGFTAGAPVSAGSYELHRFCLASGNQSRGFGPSVDKDRTAIYDFRFEYCISAFNNEGFAPITWATDTTTMDVRIWNSVSYGNSLLELRMGNALTTHTYDIRNSIFYALDSNWIVYCNDALVEGNQTIDYNCYYRSGTAGFGDFSYDGSSRTWAYWQGTIGFDVNGKNQDPLFLDAANEDFRITIDSPCALAGVNVDWELSGTGSDWFGNPVPLITPSIGIHEPTAPGSYNKFDSFVGQLGISLHDLNADTISVYLSNTIPSASGDTTKADLAEISTGNGYTGPIDTQQTWAEVSGTGTVTGTKFTIVAAGGAIAQFQYIVLYSPTSSDNLIAWWDLGVLIDLLDGETLTLKFNGGDPTGTIFTVS
jgi:hypothetical protein